MPDFSYQAKKGPTEIIEGTISAPTQQDAIHLIEEKGYVPIEITPLKGNQPRPASPRVEEKKQENVRVAKERAPQRAAPTRKGGKRLPDFVGRVSVYDICVFTRQLASFLRSHVPLLSALELIKTQSSNPKLAAILNEIATRVRNGHRFSDSLEEYGQNHFDTRYISMVRSGEAGGSLDKILEILADYLEKEEELRGQIRAALAYPALVVLVGFGTIFFLFVFAVPRLTQLFGQSYATLPLPTKILMSLAKPGWQAVFWGGFAALIGTLAYFLMGGEAKRKKFNLFLAKLPMLGSLRVKSDIARFCGTLSMLLENGVPVHQAIEITRPVLSNELLKEDLKDAQNRILAGDMMTDVIRRSPNFPPFVGHMISVGEESGQLASSLKEIERFYSRESLRGIKTLTSLIEPLFILFLSLVVGFVISGIMLPIFDMNWIK